MIQQPDVVQRQTVRFYFPDGIRGLSALFVATYHAVLYTGHTRQASGELGPWVNPLLYGHFAVSVFIVLSGFVLMLGPASRVSSNLEFVPYIMRRARRILPPYYVALVGFIVIIELVPLLQEKKGTAWDSKLPVDPAAVLAHLTMVHPFFPQWAFKIDGPMWSVPVEWWIYWLFPLILLPSWRLGGHRLSIAVAVALSAVLSLAWSGFEFAHVWYLVLFAMGMAAASAARTPHKGARMGRCVAAVWVPVIAIFAVSRGFADTHQWLSEPLLGGAVAMTLAWLSREAAAGRRNAVHSFLEARPIERLGLMGYSIYLVHSPVLALFNLATLNIDMPLEVRLAMMVFVAVPLSIGCAWLFYLAVERRFATTHMEDLRREEL